MKLTQIDLLTELIFDGRRVGEIIRKLTSHANLYAGKDAMNYALEKYLRNIERQSRKFVDATMLKIEKGRAGIPRHLT